MDALWGRKRLLISPFDQERRDSWQAVHNAGVILSGLREAMDGGEMRTCACGRPVRVDCDSSAVPDGPLVCSTCGEEKIPR